MTAVTAMARRPSIAGINRDARGDAITRYLRLAALFFLLAAVLAVEDLLAADREVRDETALRGALFFAAGASFGIVVAMFQWGWGQKLLNIGSGPIESFLPVIMLAILFGLSMDYQVFLVSRMHEEWVHTKENGKAVIVGQTETGRIITSAALIMITVFSSFVFGGEKVIKEFGIGLASAVFIDAFVLRTILVPALMHLFGKSNWWIPKWLDKKLPHLSVEPAEVEASA